MDPQKNRRDGRVAEGARLESVYRGNSIQGSNPCLSANLLSETDSVQPGPILLFNSSIIVLCFPSINLIRKDFAQRRKPSALDTAVRIP